jgi:hypothetical protein
MLQLIPVPATSWGVTGEWLAMKGGGPVVHLLTASGASPSTPSQRNETRGPTTKPCCRAHQHPSCLAPTEVGLHWPGLPASDLDVSGALAQAAASGL